MFQVVLYILALDKIIMRALLFYIVYFTIVVLTMLIINLAFHVNVYGWISASLAFCFVLLCFMDKYFRDIKYKNIYLTSCVLFIVASILYLFFLIILFMIYGVFGN